MSNSSLSPRHQAALQRLVSAYEETLAEFQGLRFVLRGTLAERWMKCGNPDCPCHLDARKRHGPYYQMSWKTRARTHSVYLTEEQAGIARQWIQNHRRLERILKRLRILSLRAARLYGIQAK